MMLKPIAIINTPHTAKWNQSTPKYHRYAGTAVRVRKKVPIRNELVVQLMRSFGMRKITAESAHQLLDVGLPKITSVLVQL